MNDLNITPTCRMCGDQVYWDIINESLKTAAASCRGCGRTFLVQVITSGRGIKGVTLSFNHYSRDSGVAGMLPVGIEVIDLLRQSFSYQLCMNRSTNYCDKQAAHHATTRPLTPNDAVMADSYLAITEDSLLRDMLGANVLLGDCMVTDDESYPPDIELEERIQLAEAVPTTDLRAAAQQMVIDLRKTLNTRDFPSLTAKQITSLCLWRAHNQCDNGLTFPTSWRRLWV